MKCCGVACTRIERYSGVELKYLREKNAGQGDFKNRDRKRDKKRFLGFEPEIP